MSVSVLVSDCASERMLVIDSASECQLVSVLVSDYASEGLLVSDAASHHRTIRRAQL